MSELESLNRKETWNDSDRARYRELTRPIKSVTKNLRKVLPKTPSVADQLDKIQEKFGNKIEPWTMFTCSKCGLKYHLVDNSPCFCGKEEGQNRIDKYLGGISNGVTK